jgi:hypothetical protein
VFQGPPEVGLEWLDSPANDLGRIRCWIPNVNKIVRPFRRQPGALIYIRKQRKENFFRVQQKSKRENLSRSLDRFYTIFLRFTTRLRTRGTEYDTTNQFFFPVALNFSLVSDEQKSGSANPWINITNFMFVHILTNNSKYNQTATISRNSQYILHRFSFSRLNGVISSRFLRRCN